MYDSEFNQADSLPFSEVRQRAVLGHLIKDKTFFFQAKEKIKPAWFQDPNCGRVWVQLLKFHEDMGRHPGKDELKEVPDILAEEVRVRGKLWSLIECAVADTDHHGLDVIKPKLTEWLHVRIYKDAAETAASLFNKHQFRPAFETMKKATREIDAISFAPEDELNFDKSYDLLQSQQLENQNAVTWGLACMDRLLTPTAGSGSLLAGDTTVVLAPTNVGKTTTLISVIAHNLTAPYLRQDWTKGYKPAFECKDILFISHEGRPEDLLEKIWCSVLSILSFNSAGGIGGGVDKPELYRLYKSKASRAWMDEVLKSVIKPHLTYVPMNKPGLTVEEVEAVVRRKQDEHVLKYGKGFDLIVDDYPAKLTTMVAQKGNMPKRQIDAYVYNFFVQMALEFKAHALLAIQTNREGYKVNQKRLGSDRLLTMEDVSESFDVMMIATNVITVNRDDEAKAQNRITYFISKSRSNETGFAVVCRSDFKRALTHADILGATWYRASSSMADRVEDLLNQYRGQEVPNAELNKTYAKAS